MVVENVANHAELTNKLDLRHLVYVIVLYSKWRDKLQIDIRGCTERRFPGCVNMGWKNCALLLAVGKQNAICLSNFTQPGKSLLVQPCRSDVVSKVVPNIG